jgi:hypothetical protein
MIVVTLTIGAGVGPTQSATFTHWTPLVGALGSLLSDDGIGTITITKSTPVDLDFVEPAPQAQVQALAASGEAEQLKIPLDQPVELSVAPVDTDAPSV